MKNSLENITRNFNVFLIKKIRVLIFLAAFLMAGCAVYIWYECLYASEWSQTEIDAYISKKDESIIFKKDNFKEMVHIFDRRKKGFEEKSEGLPDIFNLNK